MATFEEHHGADNAWSPTPLMNAGTVLARTTNLAASISALLLPLHDPIRVAEDIAVIDLMSGGRLLSFSVLDIAQVNINSWAKTGITEEKLWTKAFRHYLMHGLANRFNIKEKHIELRRRH